MPNLDEHTHTYAHTRPKGGEGGRERRRGYVKVLRRNGIHVCQSPHYWIGRTKFARVNSRNARWELHSPWYVTLQTLRMYIHTYHALTVIIPHYSYVLMILVHTCSTIYQILEETIASLGSC